jgi:membrane protease YdiL (CAAX protease family)
MEIADEPQVEVRPQEISDDLDIAPSVAFDPSYPSIWQSFGILLIFLLCTVVALPIVIVFGQLSADLAMLLFYVSAGGLAFAIVHSIRRRKLGSATYCFRIESWKLVLPLIIASVALLLGVIGPLISLIPMPKEVGEGFADMMGRPSPALFIALVIAAPLLEELLFRGIMLEGLLKRYRPLTAILASSIIFGLAHLNPWQFVTAFVIGCFAGWVYFRTASVGPCILIHATVNFCAYLIQFLVGGANTSNQSPEFQGGWGAILAFPTICLTIIFVLVLYLRREFDRLAMAQAEAEAPVA